MNTINTRRARSDDKEFISRCNIAMAKETEDKSLSPETIRAGVEAVLADPSLAFYLIAEINGQRVGQAMVTYEWSDWRNGSFWWIQSVYVDEEHRRQGVFKSLYRKLASLARAEQNVCGLRLYVMKSNRKAQSTYTQMGMVRTEYLMFEDEW